MDEVKAGEVNMDARTLDVREVGIDAAEDQFFTNRANMDMADRVISVVALVFAAACVCALLVDFRSQPNTLSG